MLQQTNNIKSLISIVIHTPVDKVLCEIVSIIKPLQFNIVLDLCFLVKRTVSSNKAVDQTPDSPDSSRKSGVFPLSVVFWGQVDVSSLVGGVGVWGEFTGGPEVEQLDLESGGVEEDVLVLDVTVVDTARDEVVDYLVRE